MPRGGWQCVGAFSKRAIRRRRNHYQARGSPIAAGLIWGQNDPADFKNHSAYLNPAASQVQSAPIADHPCRNIEMSDSRAAPWNFDFHWKEFRATEKLLCNSGVDSGQCADHTSVWSGCRHHQSALRQLTSTNGARLIQLTAAQTLSRDSNGAVRCGRYQGMRVARKENNEPANLFETNRRRRGSDGSAQSHGAAQAVSIIVDPSDGSLMRRATGRFETQADDFAGAIQDLPSRVPAPARQHSVIAGAGSANRP